MNKKEEWMKEEYQDIIEAIEIGRASCRERV